MIANYNDSCLSFWAQRRICDK